MATTLTNGATTLALHDDLAWPDEFDWQPVSQTSEYSVTGALLIDAGVRLAGRPITLQGTAASGWMPRSTVLTLAQWAAVPGVQLVLSLRGANFDVMFDHDRGALDAQPVIDFAAPVADDQYVVTLRFLEV